MVSTGAAAAPPRADGVSEGSARRGRARWWVLDAAVVAGVTVGAALLRIGPLGPSSLWLDDAWVALAHRADELGELRFVGSSAPGFVLLLRTWLAAVGFDEVTAQVLPLAAGVAAPGLAYVVARRFGCGRAAASTAAIVLVTSPMAVEHATRVKQYTVEVIVALVVLAVGGAVLADIRAPRRWGALVVVGALATAMSAFLALYVVAGVAAGLALARRRRDARGARLALLAGSTYAAVALGWYALVLGPAIPKSITGFWSGHFIVLDQGVGPAASSAADAARGVAGGLAPLPALVVGLALAMATVGVARARPELAVLLVTPVVAATVLAASARAPLGGGRTDIYLYPSLALLLAGGVEALRRSVVPRWSSPIAALAACGALVVASGPAQPYPQEDVRPLVAVLEARAADGDAVLLYPATVWAYALYTDDEVDLEPDPVGAWGFSPRFGDVDTHPLPPGREDPGAYAPTVGRLGDRAARVWLLASHWGDDYGDLQAQLGRAGFERVEVVQEVGAELSRWERR